MMMKVHPALRKRNINITPCQVASNASICTPKNKLRKLPHVFAKVLQLPFRSNADVSVHETSHTFRFTVPTHSRFRAHTLEIYPGVVKILVRRTDHQGGDVSADYDDDDDDDQLDLDLWRFRLPASTRPEMAIASCNGHELVVTVPKDLNSDDKIHVKDDEEVRDEENGKVVMIQDDTS